MMNICSFFNTNFDILFSIFINDLPLVLKSATIVMYADDVIVYDSASTAEELNEVLNKELRLIKEWVTENRLALNTEKTKSMVLASKYRLKLAPALNLSIGNKHIEQKTEVKLLELIIDDKKPIYESSYILEWLEAKFPKPSLLPVGIEETLEVFKLWYCKK